MIIEFFGLSNTGKSFLKKRLEEKGYCVFKTEKIKGWRKLPPFLIYCIKNPLKTMNIFMNLNSGQAFTNTLSPRKKITILIMRNTYLASVLAKYEILKKHKEKIYVDEYSLQSLFMIFQEKTTENNLKKVMNLLPNSERIVVFEKKREARHRAYKKKHPEKKGATLLPMSWIDKKYAQQFMRGMEKNFELIKKIIRANYQEQENFLRQLELNLPKNYKKEIYIASYKSL